MSVGNAGSWVTVDRTAGMVEQATVAGQAEGAGSGRRLAILLAMAMFVLVVDT